MLTLSMDKTMRWAGVGVGGWLMYKFIDKQGLMNTIYSILPAREAGVMAAMVLGDKTGLGWEFYQKLKDTGLVHLVIVSGSNVMLIVSGLIESFAGWVGRKWSILMGLVLGWSYVGMVGWEAPVMRAMLLVSIFYWAQILGRKYDLVRALVLAVVIMMVADREIVTSVSFWLSMTAFVGVVTMPKRGRHIGRPTLETVWVSLWVTPILGLVFGRVSVIAPVANMMVILIVELITIVGVVAVVSFGWLLWLVYPLLRYFIWVVEGLGGMNWVAVGIKFNWWMLVGWYLILFYFLIKRWEKGNR